VDRKIINTGSNNLIPYMGEEYRPLTIGQACRRKIGTPVEIRAKAISYYEKRVENETKQGFLRGIMGRLIPPSKERKQERDEVFIGLLDPNPKRGNKIFGVYYPDEKKQSSMILDKSELYDLLHNKYVLRGDEIIVRGRIEKHPHFENAKAINIEEIYIS